MANVCTDVEMASHKLGMAIAEFEPGGIMTAVQINKLILVRRTLNNVVVKNLAKFINEQLEEE